MEGVSMQAKFSEGILGYGDRTQNFAENVRMNGRNAVFGGFSLPLYEYRCTSCGYSFEKIQSFSAKPETECPKCQGALVRPVTAPALRFEGAGWYVNDYAGKGGAKAAETSATPAAEGAKPAESKPAAAESSPAAASPSPAAASTAPAK
jgi:putative FmdB family regulatory protein